MKKLLWPVVGFGLLLWSGLAWLVYNLIDWGGQFISRNADVVTPHPEGVEWLSWLVNSGSGVVEWLVIGVWALGVVLALVVGFAGSRLLPRASSLARHLKSQ